ncbi:cob(II)yrinic acid a,c-diamide reductase [Methylobacterium indicum]|uniref:Cob(II)yrinic acid a,c-diamide reductase n=2 Tax=Methylobacterium indicum TaxID=1775910 RepID=A0ABR5HGR9_9HYPH|nr:5,6-dimethylbenzimidazole synthase [Methylobacterium indicum]KMO17623.1 cob(II)yrinic acid a,c-diamide reductase [Methylobacterium indicum]KMO25834.1 cob(II)yrinic acid a,c-diamide reductase [Methylobacterium indicum]KTS37077.1 cob(II)yrinic acid a,c-diamide reductase [Methylobacterium indicum]KTS42221.1 cob(II)yrinic acid a,c-diamide reductase [Methylobacterium indicum]
MTGVPEFGADFRARFADLVAWRRDVRRFRTDPVPEDALRDCLALACLSPSVGNSQPWRFVRVSQSARRAAVAASFSRCNESAAVGYDDERAVAYRRLKLAGLREAPVHLAVFCDEATAAGHGLGRATMPEMLRYSVVTAIHTFWLAARAHGLGVGWVSILCPEEVTGVLDVPAAWRLVAYLCVGYPAEEHADPELVRHGWQARETRTAMLER